MSDSTTPIELEPCDRDNHMITLCCLLASKMQIVARQPVQMLSVSKMLCLLNEFPYCRSDESITLELLRKTFSNEQWKISRSWKIVYDGKVFPSDKEPCINLISSMYYCQVGSILSMPADLFVWSMPFHNGESVGKFNDYREQTPFPEKLKLIGEDIRSIGRLKNGKHSDSTLIENYSLKADDDNNPWQPDDNSFDREYELGVIRSEKSRPAKGHNNNPLASYTDQLIDYLDRLPPSGEHEVLPDKKVNCCSCGTPTSTTVARLDNDTYCIECWAERFKDQEAIAKIYIKDYSVGWELRASVKLPDVNIQYKHL